MVLCDSHIHVVGDAARYPLIPNRTYTPGVAAIETVQALAAPYGIQRFVIVQASFYGTDNTVLVETLGTLRGNGRGVAVVDPAHVLEDQLATLHAAGVRGVRINLYSTHGAQQADPADRFAALERLAAKMGWHVQVIAPLPILVRLAERLAASTVPVVIDHFGLPGQTRPVSEEGRRLLALVRRSHVWVKLSAPYRSTGDELGVVPDPAWLAALLDAAAARCIWGSDWPHTPAHETQPGGGAALPYRTLDYGAVVRGFRDALPSAAAADEIMGANAARLYDFAA